MNSYFQAVDGKRQKTVFVPYDESLLDEMQAGVLVPYTAGCEVFRWSVCEVFSEEDAGQSSTGQEAAELATVVA